MLKWTCVVAVGLTGTATAGIINVPDDFPEIGDAITAAENGDEIVVAPGTYPGFSFDNKTVTVRSSHGAMKTTITGSSSVRFQADEGPDTILDGFWLSGASGTGIEISGATSPTIRNCIISNHIQSGLRVTNGSPTLINCIFAGNLAEIYGGAAYITGGSSPTFVGCTFIGNSADLGGAISNYGDPDAVTTIINSVFVGNEAVFGGAILNGEGLSWMILSNCTIADNVAALGGGIVNTDLSVLTIQNSIFWGNSSQQIVSDDLAITNVSYSNVEGTWPGTGNIDAGPLFADPANGDLRLQPGSPAIDAGHNWAIAGISETDLDGNPRFANGPAADAGCGVPVIVDMGAYEFQGDPFPVKFGDIDGDGVVGIVDFLALLADWGGCTQTCCLADLDLDETVGITDFLLLLGNWTP